MHYWNDVLSIALSARWPTTTGKPMQNNTYIILSCDEKGEPEQVRLKYHATDIIVWKPNGDRYICTGWETSTTKDRLYTYGVRVYTRKLPALNGYKVAPEKSTFMSIDDVPGEVAFDGNASPDEARFRRENYIRVSKGQYDMSTVNPIRVQCVVESEKLRRRMNHLGKVIKLALGYAKLAGDNPFRDGTVDVSTWLLDRVNIPLGEITLSPFPNMFRGNPKSEFNKHLAYIRWELARNEGWLGAASLLKGD